MKSKSRFIIVKHQAKKAGLHYDIRFRKPNSKVWDSFASRKEPPTKTGSKVLCHRTTDHTEAQALFLGDQEEGYGAGRFDKFDDGDCVILRYDNKHIVVEFHGTKFKGVFHFVGIDYGNKNQQAFLFFKGKSDEVNY